MSSVIIGWAVFGLYVMAADLVTEHALGTGELPKYPQPDFSKGNPELIKRGEYLVKAGDCISCHTNMPERGQPYAGGLPLETPFGAFYAPNITPDKETGIGNWSTQDFINAMHKGIRPDGSYYFPVFPYTSFTRVFDDDLIAMKAYLDAIPAVRQKNKPPGAPWPFSWRFAQFFWRQLFFQAQFYQYNPAHSAEWNRGAYLVQGLGHCGECHTPRNFLGAMKDKYFLTGAFIGGYWAPNITGIAFKDTPLTEVVDVFDKAMLINKRGPVRGPMAEVSHNSLKLLTKYDKDAIALYLRSLNVPEPYPVKESMSQSLITGQQVYQRACAMCHDLGISGAPLIFNTASWQYRLMQGRDVLYEHAIKGLNSMPPKGGCVTCTDQEIKDAVDYILANSQSASALQQVKKARSPKADTSLARGKVVYEEICATCHAEGRLGAPKLGNKALWSQLIKKGMDVLITNTINGLNNMPPKGGCQACDNTDIIAAVKYMVQQGVPENDYSLW